MRSAIRVQVSRANTASGRFFSAASKVFYDARSCCRARNIVPMPQVLAHLRRNSSKVISGCWLTVCFSQSKSCSPSLGLRPHRWCCGSMQPSFLRWASSFFTMCTDTLKRSAISFRVPSPASYASTILCRKSIVIVFFPNLSAFYVYKKS